MRIDLGASQAYNKVTGAGKGAIRVAKGRAEEWQKEEKLLLLEGWARDGLTDDQIAENMGISVRTLYRWKGKNCQICQALKKGKEAADRQVENALFKRAIGYEYEEVREESKDGIVTKRTITTKHIPGDTTAQIFWLKNRKPDYWGGGTEFTGEGREVHIYLPDNDRSDNGNE